MKITRQTYEKDPAKTLIHRGRSMAQGDIWRIDSPDGPIAIKDIRRQPILWRVLFGRRALAHEGRILNRLQGLKGIPRFYGRIDADAFAMEFLEAGRLPHKRKSNLNPEFFRELKRIVREMHRRGIAHGDLRRKNILVCGDAVPRLIDFTTAVHRKSPPRNPLREWWFRFMCQVDILHLLDIQRGYFSKSLTSDERRQLKNPPVMLRLGRFFRQKFYRPLKYLFTGKLFRKSNQGKNNV